MSINPENAKEFIKLSKLNNKDIKSYLKDFDINWKNCISSNTKKLSKVERYNLDYYRGRFAIKSNKRLIYNWQDFRI